MVELSWQESVNVMAGGAILCELPRVGVGGMASAALIESDSPKASFAMAGRAGHREMAAL